jgi:CheY-like chemotaxis protein
MDKPPIILVVDDNEDTLDLLDEALSEADYKVIRARSGPTAMSMLMSSRIDLVFLDIAMPDMNGFAVLEMMRFNPKLMNTSVIIYTANSDQWNMDRAMELGVKAVLPKPTSPSILVQEVQKCLVAC